MTTQPTTGDSFFAPNRGARYAALILAFALSMSGNVAALGPASATDESTINAEAYEVLLERVRTEPLLNLNDPRFMPGLILGDRYGGILNFNAGFHDPMNPKIMQEDFANWNLAARASLLLSYARLVTDSNKPRPYVGLPNDERQSLIANDAEERARIRQIVQSGGYIDSWKPFAAAYRKLVQTAEKIAPTGETPSHNTKASERLADLAREQGMFQLVRELPIDPADVANEILRVLHQSRRRLGGADSVSDNGTNLLYACGENPVAIHIHPWHSLAPAFFRAAEAATGKTADPQALLIMTMFDGIGKEIHDWVAAHPHATTVARDTELNAIAIKRGLYALLKG